MKVIGRKLAGQLQQAGRFTLTPPNAAGLRTLVAVQTERPDAVSGCDFTRHPPVDPPAKAVRLPRGMH
jgi:hypothetical protein